MAHPIPFTQFSTTVLALYAGPAHAPTATIAYTGLRRDEALTLKAEDVSLATGLLAVSDRTRRKTAISAAPVPIPPELAQILATWLPILRMKRPRGP